MEDLQREIAETWALELPGLIRWNLKYLGHLSCARERAEEIAQEAGIRAHVRWEKAKGKKLGAWIFRINQNLLRGVARNETARKKAWEPMSDYGVMSPIDSDIDSNEVLTRTLFFSERFCSNLCGSDLVAIFKLITNGAQTKKEVAQVLKRPQNSAKERMDKLKEIVTAYEATLKMSCVFDFLAAVHGCVSPELSERLMSSPDFKTRVEEIRAPNSEMAVRWIESMGGRTSSVEEQLKRHANAAYGRALGMEYLAGARPSSDLGNSGRVLLFSDVRCTEKAPSHG